MHRVEALPEPAIEARERSAELAARLRAEIAEKGPIGFDRFMQRALYEPGLGYYAAGARIFGRGGDFVTAPELGPRFATCVARAIAPHVAGHDVVELGAGSGALAAVAIDALVALGAAPKRWRIVEIASALRERQRERIGESRAGVAIEWLHAPPAEPWRGALLANEVADALPCTVFAVREAQVFERRVGLEGERFAWTEQPGDTTLDAAVRERVDLDALHGPFISDYVPMLGPWLAEVTRGLAQGLALIVDYGDARRALYAPHRNAGSLRAFLRQRVSAEVLAFPGAMDLTSDVDFTALAYAGHNAGLDVLAWAPQSAFLLAHGALDAMPDAEDARASALAAEELRRLMLPGEMGERFHVLALGRGVNAPTLTAIDRSERL